MPFTISSSFVYTPPQSNRTIRVYGTSDNGTIVEWIYDTVTTQWYAGNPLPGAKAGVGTTVTSVFYEVNGVLQIHLYYRGESGNAMDLFYNGIGWAQNQNLP